MNGSRFLLQRYQSEAKIESVDGLAMVKEMAEDMENMMADKVDAIKVRPSFTHFVGGHFWRSAHRSSASGWASTLNRRCF